MRRLLLIFLLLMRRRKRRHHAAAHAHFLNVLLLSHGELLHGLGDSPAVQLCRDGDSVFSLLR
jgi:hypothetical protein